MGMGHGVRLGVSSPNRGSDRPTHGAPKIQNLQSWFRGVPHGLPQLMPNGSRHHLLGNRQETQNLAGANANI